MGQHCALTFGKGVKSWELKKPFSLPYTEV